MKKTPILAFATVVILSGMSVWLFAAPSVGVVTIAPATIVVNSPTAVTVAVQIPDSSVIATGVNLLRVDSTGRTLATLGTLRDNGLGDDAVAGDQVFSGQVTFTEPNPGRIYLRVSAAFRGVLRRELSAVASLEVVSATLEFVDAAAGYRISYPRDMGVASGDILRPGFLSATNFTSADGLPNVSVAVYENLQSLPVEQWYQAVLADKEYRLPDGINRTATAVIVDGVSSLQVRSTLLGHIQIRTFVPSRDGRVFGIETSFADDGGIPEAYLVMLETFRLD